MMQFAKRQDVEELLSLWEEAFGKDELSEKFYESAFEEMSVLVAKDGGRIVSMLHYIPCCYDDGSGKCNGAYLYALATTQTFRGKGIMKSLIKQALNLAKERGDRFVFLVPAKPGLYGFYEKNGFSGKLFETDECNLHFSQIIEEYVELENAMYGSENPETGISCTDSENLGVPGAANGACGVICMLDKSIKIDNINGMIPY